MKIELEDFENTTSLYIEGLQKDKNMRYRSFDHCYFYFKDNYEKSPLVHRVGENLRF